MKIGLAQIRSQKGALGRNVARHLAVLRGLAGAVDLVVFPELSLCNYDPEIARSTAVRPGDAILAPLQRFADASGVVVGAGAPVFTGGKPRIAMLVFTPGQPCTVIGKRHLHTDEQPFFSPAETGAAVLALAVPVGVAICYEISVLSHTDDLMAAGAAVYLASVAKTADGLRAARSRLAETARRHGVPTLLVNSVGTCEGKPAGGGSLAFSRGGRLAGALGASAEGVLVYDTKTDEAASLPAAR